VTMQIIKVQWRPIKKPFNSILSGHQKSNGTMELLVDKIPKPKCDWIGDFIYGEEAGYCQIFEFKAGTIDGFGGRTIKIKFNDGAIRTFVGCLWDPFSVPNTVPKHRHVSVTTDPRVMDRGFTFSAGKITAELFSSLAEDIGLALTKNRDNAGVCIVEGHVYEENNRRH